MRLSNCINLVQKIGAFTLVYFFSFSSYQAQEISKANLINNSNIDSKYSVCNSNKGSNLFDSFNYFSISANGEAIFDSQLQIENFFSTSQLAAANITLGEYLELSRVQKAIAENLVSKGVENAFFAQNLQGTFQFTQVANVKALNNCDRDFCSSIPDRYERCVEYRDDCGGCPECDPRNT